MVMRSARKILLYSLLCLSFGCLAGAQPKPKPEPGVDVAKLVYQGKTLVMCTGDDMKIKNGNLYQCHPGRTGSLICPVKAKNKVHGTKEYQTLRVKLENAVGEFGHACDRAKGHSFIPAEAAHRAN